MTKVGLLLPTRESVMYSPHTGDPRPLVELAVEAEQAGFDSVWAGDSLLAKPRAEPLTLLAGVATATERVELGTAVLLPSQRNPEQLAQSTATLDALSGGRFILGIGGGPAGAAVRADHDYVGADFDRRASRSIEVVERVQALWRGEAEAQMYPLTGREGGPPIWIGGSGPRTLQRTARMADGWFPIAPLPKFAEAYEQLGEDLEAQGRSMSDLTVAIYLTVVLGEPAQAQAQLADHSTAYYGAPHDVISKVQASAAGSAEQIVEFVDSFVQAGADHVCVRFGCDDPLGQLELFAPLLAHFAD